MITHLIQIAKIETTTTIKIQIITIVLIPVSFKKISSGVSVDIARNF